MDICHSVQARFALLTNYWPILIFGSCKIQIFSSRTDRITKRLSTWRQVLCQKLRISTGIGPRFQAMIIIVFRESSEINDRSTLKPTFDSSSIVNSRAYRAPTWLKRQEQRPRCDSFPLIVHEEKYQCNNSEESKSWILLCSHGHLKMAKDHFCRSSMGLKAY